jgi:hypothetical protein
MRISFEGGGRHRSGAAALWSMKMARRSEDRYIVAAPLAGKLKNQWKAGDSVEAGTTAVATIDRRRASRPAKQKRRRVLAPKQSWSICPELERAMT